MTPVHPSVTLKEQAIHKLITGPYIRDQNISQEKIHELDRRIYLATTREEIADMYAAIMAEDIVIIPRYSMLKNGDQVLIYRNEIWQYRKEEFTVSAHNRFILMGSLFEDKEFKSGFVLRIKNPEVIPTGFLN